ARDRFGRRLAGEHDAVNAKRSERLERVEAEVRVEPRIGDAQAVPVIDERLAEPRKSVREPKVLEVVDDHANTAGAGAREARGKAARRVVQFVDGREHGLAFLGADPG